MFDLIVELEALDYVDYFRAQECQNLPLDGRYQVVEE